jgi:hypothetical protein
MPSPNVDLVLVIDASESMQPCFDALRVHLDKLILPLQGYAARLRFGLVAQSAGSDRGQAIYDHQFLCGSGLQAIKKLYQRGPNDPDPRNEFFTADPKRLTAALKALKPQGNEEMLVALDVAADFPFGPLSNTKRVIALYSDEPFEDGVTKGGSSRLISKLMDKLEARHIKLFMAVPEGSAGQELTTVDGASVRYINGGDGLKSVDFGQLLGQMGKSISVASLQSAKEPPYERALFGQNGWTDKEVASLEMREKIGHAGEVGGITVQARKLGVLLDTSPSMTAHLSALRSEINRNFPNAAFREVDGSGLYQSKEEFLANLIARCRDEGKIPGGVSDEMAILFVMSQKESKDLLDSLRLGALDSLKDLVRREGCDAVYWFCDLQDGGSRSAVSDLTLCLSSAGVKFYVRSLDKGADRYPGLENYISSSGGELRRG